MAQASQGALAKLYVQNGSGQLVYNTSAEAYEFQSESLSANRPVLDTAGIRGTRSLPYERTRLGIRQIGGTLVMNPGPAQLDAWLPRILGTAANVDTFELGEVFNAFGVYVDRVAIPYEYTECRVSRATFRAQVGGLMEMSIDLVGGDEFKNVTAATNAPSIGLTSAHGPYVFHDTKDAALLPPTATATELFDIEINIDNFFDARFVNATTATSFTPADRLVTVGLTVPFDASTTVLHRITDAQRGHPGSIAFTNPASGFATTFSFASLDGPDVSPNVNGKGEITYRADWVARSSAAVKELVVTNVAT